MIDFKAIQRELEKEREKEKLSKIEGIEENTVLDDPEESERLEAKLEKEKEKKEKRKERKSRFNQMKRNVKEERTSRKSGEITNEEIENIEIDYSDPIYSPMYNGDPERERSLKRNIVRMNRIDEKYYDGWMSRYKESEAETILKDIDEQRDVANKILDSLNYKDAVILEAPTGWGKTGLAYQIWKQSGKRVLVLNHSNVLLKQYRDLLELNLKDRSVSCMGKSNYRCLKYKSKPCNSGTDCGGCIYADPEIPLCEYYWRRMLSGSRGLVISNYHQQILLEDLEYDIIICDECHNIENILVDFATVKADLDFVNKLDEELRSADSYKNKSKEEKITSENPQINKLKRILNVINENNYEEQFKNFYDILDSLKTDYIDHPNVKDLIDSYYESYSRYKDDQSNKTNYIYEEKSGEYEFKLVPLKVDGMFKDKILKKCDKIVLMSATVINHENMIKDLGLDKDKTEYIELDSKIPVENRKIFYFGMGKLSMKGKDEDILSSPDYTTICNTITTIVKEHEREGDSGFIYCNSYRLCKLIYEGIKLNLSNWNILMNTDSKQTKEVLDKFLDTTKKNRLLISCSFAEGVNFNDDISRFQIIPKVPYLYLGSKRIALKNQMNNRWYVNKAIEQIIQVAGRSVRSPEDKAVTYILDKAFSYTYKKYQSDYPSWFNEAIIWEG